MSIKRICILKDKNLYLESHSEERISKELRKSIIGDEAIQHIVSTPEEVLDVLDVIKGKLEKAKQTLNEINQLKDEEDRELAAWSANIEDIESKVDMVDKTIFGAR